jgi:hypothetical protein
MRSLSQGKAFTAIPIEDVFEYQQRLLNLSDINVELKRPVSTALQLPSFKKGREGSAHSKFSCRQWRSGKFKHFALSL